MKAYFNDIFQSELFIRYTKREENIRNLNPSDERTAELKSFIRDIEADILGICGDVLDCDVRARKYINPYEYELMYSLLSMRSWALNNLFHIHCSDEEVRRFTAVNQQLYDMTCHMYERVRMVGEHVETMPIHEKDDDVGVRARLRFCEFGASSVLELEDDEYYGSDFSRMIVLLAMIERDYICYDAIHNVFTMNLLNGGKGAPVERFRNHLDDGTTWAEAWLNHPKLDHLVICYATYCICAHMHYSIPDLLRMNTFEVSVDVNILQIQDQDGTRFGWREDLPPDQIKAKLLAEAEHRPERMTLGDFIYRRCRAYYDDLVDEVPQELDCRKCDENIIPFMDHLIRTMRE